MSKMNPQNRRIATVAGIIAVTLATMTPAAFASSSRALVPAGTTSPTGTVIVGTYPTSPACNAAGMKLANQTYWRCQERPDGQWDLYGDDGYTD